MKYKFKTILVSLFFFVSTASAFEGELTYEILNNLLDKKVMRPQIKLFMKDSQIRIDTISNRTRSIYFNYSSNVGYYVDGKISQKIDLKKVYNAPEFLMPEEITKTGLSKVIFENKTVEYETFYFNNKVRLPVKIWYSPQTFSGSYTQVWELYDLQPEMIIVNYFVNPITRQIAFEINFTGKNKIEITYKLVKIVKNKPSDSYFNPP